MSVERAAKGLIAAHGVSEGVLNMIEMAFRAYDPCNGCATHALPGSIPLFVNIRDAAGRLTATVHRDSTGSVVVGGCS